MAGIKSTLPQSTLHAEYRFHKKRAWRFDYFLTPEQIAIEIEGATFAQGRHTRGAGFAGDIDKYNTATCAGIAVYRVTTADLTNPDRIVEHLKAIRFMAARRPMKAIYTEAVSENLYAMRSKRKKRKVKA